ncbi:beta strand repeat-containing protein [Halobacteriovorax sp. ZH4_bin.1]|uniref:beta strand repeat-containing protein n=1 Tax=unclassified Halobacteriovorax TaxID=2639665 RepID=UPI003722747B
MHVFLFLIAIAFSSCSKIKYSIVGGGSISIPTVSLLDSDSSSEEFSNDLTVGISVANTDGATKFCISETQTTQPTDTATCNGGTWMLTPPATYTFTPGEGSRDVYVWTADSADHISEDPIVGTIEVDTVAPTTVITTPPATVIDESNQTSFTLSGSCSEDDGEVQVSNAINATTTCSGGVWNVDVDTAAIPNGSLDFDVVYTDSAGNSSVQETITLTKNVSMPDPTLTMSSSDSNDLTVGLSVGNDTYATMWCLSETQATKPVDTSTCADGSWVTTEPTDFTFSAGADGSRTVYIWTATTGDYISDNPISATVNYDTSVPSVTITNTAGEVFGPSATLSGTCTEDGNVTLSGNVVTKSTACTGGNWSDTFDFSTQADGAVTVSATVTDNAGNISSPESKNFSKTSSYLHSLNIDTINSYDIDLSYAVINTTNLQTYKYQIATGTTAPSDCSTGVDFGNTNLSQSISSLDPSTQYSLTVCYIDTSSNTIGQQSTTFTTAAIASSGTSLTCSGGGDVNTTCYVNDLQTMADATVIYIPGNLVIQSGGDISSNAVEKIIMQVDGSTTIESGGKISANLTLLSTTTLDIQAGASIDVSSKGYAGGASGAANGTGPSGGFGFTGTSADPGGAGHAGPGGDGRSSGGTTVYGSRTEPVDFGSGGGAGDAQAGGAGGGVAKIIATNLNIDGNILAQGGAGVNSCCDQGAGGSGGSLWITSQTTITGSGIISVNGGSAGGINGSDGTGAGAAGRLAIYQNSGVYTFNGTIGVSGGSVGTRASDGSFYLALASNDQLCDSGNFSSTCIINTSKVIGGDTIITSGNLTIDTTGNLSVKGLDSDFAFNNAAGNFTIASGGVLSMDAMTAISNIVANNFNMAGTLNANISDSTISNAIISGSINANNKGYFGGRAMGNGGGPAGGIGTDDNGGGGGHATDGFNGNAGTAGAPAYGSISAPVEYGSGGGAGGSRIGGSGGGAVKLSVTNTLDISGTISANGGNGQESSDISGGGAGGSIWLSADNLVLAATLTATGGTSGHTNSGGNGAGGRISIIANQATVNASVSHLAGRGVAEGTAYVNIPNIYPNCSGGGDVLTTCYINDTQTLMANVTYTILGNLTLQSGALVQTPDATSIGLNIGSNLVIESGGTLAANITELNATNIDIQSGGAINLNGRGYTGGRDGGADGKGPSPGLGNGTDESGGAGHASPGANGEGGSTTGGSVTYGVASSPIEYGSSAGSSNGRDGGDGGGAIKIITDDLIVNGSLTANGTDGASSSIYAAGGGAGGSIWLQVNNSFSGTGLITAKGGAGMTYTYGAGSGSGGRIAIEFNGASYDFSGSVLTTGGLGKKRAGDGTFYLALSNPSAICDSGDLVSTCFINQSKTIGANYTINANNLEIADSVSLSIDGLNPGIAVDLTGNLTLKPNSSISYPANARGIELLADGNVTLETNATILANLTNLEAQTLDLQTGSSLNAKGLGYLGAGLGRQDGFGISPGLSNNTDEAGGGAHASAGGNGEGAATLGGQTPYGSETNPVDYGSGGGASKNVAGGNGGGAIKIVANDIILNGSILAQGNDGATTSIYASGGGAGGSVWIQAANSIIGSGNILVSGGEGKLYYYGSGSGSGGRLSIELAGSNYNLTGVVNTNGGSSSKHGGPGTFHLGLSTNDAICDSGNFATTCTIASTKPLGNNIVLTGANLILSPSAGLAISGHNGNFSIDLTGSLSLQAGSSITYTEYLRSISIAADTAITIENGSSINANLSLLETSAFDLQSGGLISAVGLGYYGSRNRLEEGFGPSPGLTNSNDEAGGGAHGGNGGNGENATSTAGGNSPYGSLTAPITFGSGGGSSGNYRGGNGGGAIKIIADTVNVDGEIKADANAGAGASIYAAGGGAGGSIWITANTSFTGTGNIQAKGGNSGGRGAGSGSGGRLSVDMTTSTNTFSGMFYYGPGASTHPGDSGTLNLTYTTLDEFCDVGTSTTTCEINNVKWLPSDLFAGNLTLNNDVYLFDSTTNITVTGDLLVKSGATIQSQNRDKYTFDISGDATIEAGATMKVNLADFIATNLDLAGTVDVSEKGYTSTSGPGGGKDSSGGNNPGGGASYGSVGGQGYSSNTWGNLYGDETAPTDLGSGGGRETNAAGGDGGGAVKFSISNLTNFTGSILSNGGDGENNGDRSSGGSGGSIWINTGSITGNGSMAAQGGSASGSSSGYGGAGRIAITMTDISGVYQYGGAIDMKNNDFGIDEGSFYVSLMDQDSICTTGGFGSTCTVSNDLTLGGVQSFTGAGNFILDTAMTLRVYGNNTDVGFNVNGNFSTAISSLISASKDITQIHSGGVVTFDGSVEAGLPDVYAVGDINVNAPISSLGKGELPGRLGHNGYGTAGGVACSSGDNPAGAGGHAGAGGNGYCANSGVTYGSATEPNTAGSGGGSDDDGDYSGGAGGGVIWLVSDANVNIAASVDANGVNGNSTGGTGGSGAGGSVYVKGLTCDGSGNISTIGGSNTTGYRGSGGGGGRIHVNCGTNNWLGLADASGGLGADASRDGGVGSVDYTVIP